MFAKKYVVNSFVSLALLFSCSAAEEDFSPSDQKHLAELKNTGKSFNLVARKVSPAVVMIKVEKEVATRAQNSFDGLRQDELFRRFFDLPRQPRQEESSKQKKRMETGQGSGFIISSDGYILTNNHVIGDADFVKVSLKDGRKFEAKVIGTDPKSDLAVIKIEGEDFPVLKMGSSSKLEVGEWVLAVGNPFGLSHTLTAGIVSAKGRSGVGITDYEDFIQTDAAINPGNSGGPLVDLNGEAIGINTAIFSRSGGYMGIGFAIPIDMVKKIKTQLIEKGSVTRGFLGIAIQDLSPDLAESFATESGIIVSQVNEDSPAAKGGLENGDIIISLNGQKVDQVATFRNDIAMMSPDDKCKIEVLRKGETKILSVKVGSRKDSLLTDDFGLQVTELDAESRKEYSVSRNATGVLIKEVKENSQAARAGLKAGMVIMQVNHVNVDSVDDYQQAVNANANQVLLLVNVRGYARYLILKKN